jgi:hypothetical protein
MNIACFVSNQSIARGDACRVFPIVQQSSFHACDLTRGEEKTSAFGISSSMCYADSMWRPVGGMMPAVYDDYGRLLVQFDPLVRAHMLDMFDQLLRVGYITAQGSNPSHDVPFDMRAFMQESAPQLLGSLGTKEVEVEADGAKWREGAQDEEFIACWKYLCRVLWQQRVFVSRQGTPRPLAIAVMHEHVYQELIARMASGTTYASESLEPVAFLQRALSESREKIKAYEPVVLDRPFIESYRLADLMRSAVGRTDGQSGHLPNLASNTISGLSLALVENRLTEAEYLNELKPFLLDQYAYGSLNDLNLRISPMVPADQDHFNARGVRYAEFINKVSSSIVRSRQIHQFGPFMPYQAKARTIGEMAEIVSFMCEWDAAIVDVVSTPDGDEFLVAFSCTLDDENLRDAMTEKGFSLMAETLTLLDQSIGPPANH